jgi:hypothetical protein
MNWVSRFTTGHLSTEGKEYSGRPNQVTILKKCGCHSLYDIG